MSAHGPDCVSWLSALLRHSKNGAGLWCRPLSRRWPQPPKNHRHRFPMTLEMSAPYHLCKRQKQPMRIPPKLLAPWVLPARFALAFDKSFTSRAYGTAVGYNGRAAFLLRHGGGTTCMVVSNS